jgi:methyl-accepting chemotaxis protein
MKKLSAGNLAVSVTPKDDRDEISPAINKTAESLRGLVDEAKTLTTAALDGRLSTRGDAHKFQGGYREIVQGVNDTSRRRHYACPRGLFCLRTTGRQRHDRPRHQ